MKGNLVLFNKEEIQYFLFVMDKIFIPEYHQMNKYTRLFPLGRGRIYTAISSWIVPVWNCPLSILGLDLTPG